VTGEKTLEIIEVLKPGDVILRGFRHYLDGKFVPSKSGWSHGAVFVGNNQIIHAVAKGVSKIDVVDFTRCDRIAILRPKKGQRKAIACAKRFLKNKTPYDFGFERDVSSLYCFELCGECYRSLKIEGKTIRKMFGLIKKDNVFLAESFFDSPDFDCVFQYNPLCDVDFRK